MSQLKSFKELAQGNLVKGNSFDSAKKDNDEDAELRGADDFTVKQLKIEVVCATQEWVETEEGDLDNGETLADRYLALLYGIADLDEDGEISEEEETFLDIIYDVSADYLVDLGVSEEDVDALLNDADTDAAERVRELIAATMPDGEEEAQDHANEYAFNSETNGDVFDAVYRKKFVVRKGKKIRKRVRVSGRVRRTSGQKMAIKKARRRAWTGAARMRRAKSMRKRKTMNL